MKRRRRSLDLKRRTPKQARSHDTVEAIFEAAAQILQEDGREALNTNRIAIRAGVSVGSLYQYFPNKEAILIAMAQRQLATTRAAVGAALAKAPSLLPEQRARFVVRSLIAAFGPRRKLQRRLIEAVFTLGFYAEINRSVEEVARTLAEHAPRLAPRLAAFADPLRLFVLTRAIAGVIRAAVMEEAPFLGSQALEDELVALVISYAARPGVPTHQAS